MKKLREDDAQALDLLLENGLDSSPDGSISSVDSATIKRVGVVESVLRLVSEMPAGDPPRDLVNRTLSFVYAASSARRDDAGAGLTG